MLEIHTNFEIAYRTTFRINAIVAYFAELHSLVDVHEALSFAKSKNLPAVFIGGGSNSIFDDSATLQACVFQIKIGGIEIVKETDFSIELLVGGGVAWDTFVDYAVLHEYSGVEALSAIPGSVGGVPVQNVGAYGVEVKDLISFVQVYNVETNALETLTNAECAFTYRDSIFKTKIGKKFIILKVAFLLSKNKEVLLPAYAGVQNYFESKGITSPTLSDIRNGIIDIRSNKLPDPRHISSCGSFFKNPIVETRTALSIKAKYPSCVIYDLGNGYSKIGAGWIIDTLGFKGAEFGEIQVYPHNALVLVNKGKATHKDLINVVKIIQDKVFNVFNIELETEPVFITS